MLDIIQNIIFGITITATIGPVTIETIRRGLKQGFFAAFILNLGAVAADSLYMFVIFLGLSQLLNETIRLVLGVFGVLILMYLGISSIKEYFDKKILEKYAPRTGTHLFMTGFSINVTNPLALIFWLGFYGFISSTSAYGSEPTMIFLNLLGVILGAIIWGLVLSVMSSIGKKYVNDNSMRYVSLAAGIILIGFAAYLGYTVYSNL